MRRGAALEILRKRFPELARDHHVRTLSIFGSVAWDEAGPDGYGDGHHVL